ncbi:hypothetical protein EYF80_023747 [Liparis tanakae]|uniref:Uncharacterized protein n=1 Tax=Liparis tanakae TaxID=230148 RepID=A0A4Z2HK74_9TELE|nr:hypothetical protein EYF80_023747 [Liparis tanakae]
MWICTRGNEAGIEAAATSLKQNRSTPRHLLQSPRLDTEEHDSPPFKSSLESPECTLIRTPAAKIQTVNFCSARPRRPLSATPPGISLSLHERPLSGPEREGKTATATVHAAFGISPVPGAPTRAAATAAALLLCKSEE